jgi:hypothetical protein
MSNDTVTIPRKMYEELIESQRWLTALESAGVDNWDGIDYAHEIHLELLDNEDE